MVAFTFASALRSITASRDTAVSESTAVPEPLGSDEIQNLQDTGDPSIAGFDYNTGPGDASVAGFDSYVNPGDASVAGFDVYSPGDVNTAGFDYADTPNEDSGGSLDPSFAEDEYGQGGESITLDTQFQGQEAKRDISNPLNKYSTYSYGISLHYMTIKQYNDVVGRGLPFATNNNQVLIASGGRRGSNFSRHPKFELDMYITELKMTTIIGLNSQNKGTNAINVEFTVSEPMGASFLENLVSVAADAGIKMWDQMPLLLQVDFFAINPDGTYAPNPIPNLTKYMSVKIIDIKINITQRGAEYKIKAVPQSHAALQSKTVNIPANFEITAKTVQEFFKSTGSTALQFDLPPNQPNQPKTAENPSRDENQSEAETRRLGINASPKPKSYSTLSLADALNEYQKELAKKGYQEVADEYVFVIDSEIERAQIFVKEAHNLSQAPVQNDKVKKDTLDKSSGVIPINAGSNLIEVINNIVRSSDYYRASVTPSEGQSDTTAAKSQPIPLHKIVTTVEYLDQWDNKRKVYKKRITFNILKFIYHNNQYPNAKKSIPKDMDKEYNYIFMGKNQEILDLKIEFNTLFFQSLTAFETKTAKDNLDTSEEYAFTEGIAPGVVKAAAKGSSGSAGGIQTLRYETTPTNISQNQLNDGSKKTVQAVDLFNSVFNRPGGDMISINLEIAGDPDLIKQDDVFYPPNAPNRSTSIPSDRKQLFMRLSFKIPKDMNTTTGMYEFETKNSAFSGIYNIIQVENTFSNGAFKQKLNCVRLFDQPEDNKNRQKSRQETANTSPIGIAGQDTERGITLADNIKEINESTGGLLDESLTRTTGDRIFVRDRSEEPQTDLELANYQQWPEQVAVDQSDYEFPGT